jgi:hypothetical protein
MLPIPAYTQTFHKSQRPARPRVTAAATTPKIIINRTRFKSRYMLGLLSSLMYKAREGLLEINC